MKKNKAFTLIEILAVVTIIGLIFILVIPKITTSLKNKKSDVDTTTTNLVLSATKLYVSDHSSKFEKEDGNISCMPLHQLVKKGYLDGPVKNVTDDKDITNGKSVRITYDKGFKYELVDSSECKIRYCNSEYCDSDGNGYTKVDYIEGDGTQYVDTGYYANGNTVVEAKLYTDETGNKNWFGGSGYSSNSNFAFNSYSVISIEYRYGNSDWKRVYLDKSVFSGIFTVSFGEKIYINNNLIAENYKQDFKDNVTLTIFERNGNHKGIIAGRIYNFKILEGSKEIMSFIPVVDKNDKGCLFDTISRKCYYDQNGNGFKVKKKDYNYNHNDENGNKYAEVNFIANSGTQYIDTGYYANGNTVVEAKLYTKETGNKNWFGGTGGSKPAYAFNAFTTNQIEYRYGNSSWQRSDVLSMNVVNRDFKISFGEKIYIDEALVAESNASEFQDNKSLTIFVRNGGSGYILGRVYYFKIKEGDSIIKDFIPVIDETGEACLFDKVENKCYYNQGTGEFLWG